MKSLRLGYEGVGQLWAQHVRMTADRIRDDIARGRIAPLDADETAEALILMSERYLGEHLGRRSANDGRPVVQTLVTIWQRALYGETR